MAWNMPGIDQRSWGGDFFNSSYQNINPLTNSIFGQLGDEMNWLKGGMGGAYGNMANMIASATSMNPNAWYASFMNAAPGLGALATDRGRAEEGMMEREGKKAATDVAAQFSDMGAQFSGGMGTAANEAAMNVRQGWLENVLGRESATRNMLYGTAMPLFAQGQGQQMNALLQGAGLYGNQGQMYGSLFGQGMGIMGDYGTPMYTAQMSPWQGLMQGIGAVGGLFGGMGNLARGGGFPSLFGTG